MIEEIIERVETYDVLEKEHYDYLYKQGWFLDYKEGNPAPVLFTTQYPYLELYYGRIVYQAHAKDLNGNDYLIIWEIKEGYEDEEDESVRCNWQDYTVDELI